ASIRNALVEIKKINLKENKKSYYINKDEWDTWLQEEIELAIGDASVEVKNGIYTEFQLAEMVDKNNIISIALQFIELTYIHSVKDLPKAITEIIIKLPGSEKWQ
ncbi:MAG: hypothetical protein EAZ76_16895, partial [Nostocales cyanobacterium]